MRAAFSDTLVRLAQADPKVLLLTGDHGYALFDDFRKHCPQQYINAGIAEQNMVGMAAGLARVGFKPFVYGLSAFVPVRVLEQIKLDIAHDDLPVVLLGDGAGFVYSHLGTSHQSTEDIACTRAVPSLTVLSPADRFELRACMMHAYHNGRPVYMRMGKSDRGDVHTDWMTEQMVTSPLRVATQPAASSAKGDGVAFIATGSMVKTAVEVAEQYYPAAKVWSVACIKPMDQSAIQAVCSGSKAVVVMEEHSVIGGLGSAILEACAERNPTRMLRVGVPDRFSEHCGTYNYLLKEHGLDAPSVASKVDAFLAAQS